MRQYLGVSETSGSNLRAELRGTRVVAIHEFLAHVTGARMVLISMILGLGVVAGAYGLSLMALKPEAGLIPVEMVGEEAGFALYMTSFLMAMLASVCALIMGFDAFVVDEMDNMKGLLWSKPLTPRAIATGKLLGIYLAVGAPALLISLTAVHIVTTTTGQSIPFGKALIFVLLTQALILSMIIIQMIISIISKTLGGAVMGGVGVWLLYTVFWLMVSLSIAQFMGVLPSNPGNLTAEQIENSMEFSRISNRVDLFNPIGAYHLCTGLLLAEGTETITIPHYYPYMALMLWCIVPYILMVWLYSRSK